MEPTDLEKQIGDLEVAIDRLRSLYEQYFMGIEKLEPNVPRKDVDRRIHALRKEPIRNTALRFRFQMILQRYNTFQSHWQRICREIENGTYKRLLHRAEQKFAADTRKKKPTEPPPELAFPEPGALLPRDLAAELAELDREFAPGPAMATSRATPAAAAERASQGGAKAPAKGVPQPAAPRAVPAPAPTPVPASVPARVTAPAPARAPAPAPARAQAAKSETGIPAAPQHREDGLPEYRVRQLYVEYVEAKRRQRESTASITYEGLAESLRASGERLRQKHGKAVDFEVGVKDGKAVLRPRLK